ncbi:MAG: hypothetical protein J1E38_06210 [Paramuribaculum sp.]|nr:hypothetical protein [Paramuribaculum sp.]
MNFKRIFLTCLALIIGCSLMSAKRAYKSDSTKITNYFIQYIQGIAEKPFSDAFTLSYNEIEGASEFVWNCWREANRLIDEEKVAFTEIPSLSQADSAKIVIPASLENDAVMTYYFGSKGDKPQPGYPLFIYTHGSGPKAREWATGLRICSEFADTPSVYFIPRIPNEGEYYRWWQKGKQYVWEKLIRQAMLSDNINPDRIYIFGISEGGYGSQRLGSFYADYLAGAGPMAGGEPLQNAPAENVGNIAFSLRTGAEDKGFYRETLTRNIGIELDSLQKLYPERYKHWVELIPGRGHSIDYKPTTPWLKNFTRSPYPKKVIWENFEMDGIKRKGFYNLAVTEPDTVQSRTRYDLDIEGNTIDLKVSRVNYSVVEKDPQWGIPLKFARSYTEATKGKVTIYLNSELVDLRKPVKVVLNGRNVYNGKVKCELSDLVNSCALFFDSRRLFPASITVEL